MTRLKYLVAGVFGVALVAVLAVKAQNPPAPTVDRVGFPANYQSSMNLLYVFDRPDNKQVHTAYANASAFGVKNGAQNDYPYGSVIVFENWPALQDAQGVAVLDANGRFTKDPAATPTINVMRKEKGFGVDYGPNRNGEWEYVAYTPAGNYATAPQNSFTCAVCHLQAGQGKDWVFRAALHFNNASGAVPGAVIKNYAFVPGTMHVKAGAMVTLYNDDVVRHTIVDDSPGGFASPLISAGSSIQLQFGDTPFEWDFHCSIHPGMKGKIIVDPK
jgi:plastocyanin